MNFQQMFQNMAEYYESLADISKCDRIYKSSADISKCDRSLCAQPLISCDDGLLLHLYTGMWTKIVKI